MFLLMIWLALLYLYDNTAGGGDSSFFGLSTLSVLCVSPLDPVLLRITRWLAPAPDPDPARLGHGRSS